MTKFVSNKNTDYCTSHDKKTHQERRREDSVSMTQKLNTNTSDSAIFAISNLFKDIPPSSRRSPCSVTPFIADKVLEGCQSALRPPIDKRNATSGPFVAAQGRFLRSIPYLV
eukprot:GHVP01003863.1.p1 GENE.GHVP01003863.1~~GHVP01003863.1.p1  ORF type:complete len:112 (-),score=14.94 GHVP01003863.1:34-369(-)